MAVTKCLNNSYQLNIFTYFNHSMKISQFFYKKLDILEVVEGFPHLLSPTTLSHVAPCNTYESRGVISPIFFHLTMIMFIEMIQNLSDQKTYRYVFYKFEYRYMKVMHNFLKNVIIHLKCINSIKIGKDMIKFKYG